MWNGLQLFDLESIEYSWDHLKGMHVEYKEHPKGLLELWKRAGKEWSNILASVCQNLIYSMSGRVKAMLKAKGGHTKC